MMMPGMFSDPSERLLTERIPVQFFGFALVAHLLFWVGLGVRTEEVMDYYSGDWAALSVMHVLTIGVLLTVALGASMQMLPVALTLNAPKTMACDAVFVLLTAGAGLLVSGFEFSSNSLLQYGALALTLAVLIYVGIVAPLLFRAKVQNASRAFLAVALMCLLVVVVLGGTVASNYAVGFLDEPLAMTRAHAVVGGFGVMGFLVLGFSLILVPMLALARVTPTRLVPITFCTAVVTLGLAFVAAWAEDSMFWQYSAAGLFLVTALIHAETMRRILAKRMKDALGTAFVLIRASWVGLVLAAVVCLLTVIFPDWEQGPALTGWLFLVGWLLSVLTGILQRVIPFLASMNAGRDGGVPVPVSRLTADRPFQVHVVAHLLAVVLGSFAIGFGVQWLMLGAAVSGGIGASAFLLAALSTGQRLRNLRMKQ